MSNTHSFDSIQDDSIQRFDSNISGINSFDSILEYVIANKTSDREIYQTTSWFAKFISQNIIRISDIDFEMNFLATFRREPFGMNVSGLSMVDNETIGFSHRNTIKAIMSLQSSMGITSFSQNSEMLVSSTEKLFMNNVLFSNGSIRMDADILVVQYYMLSDWDSYLLSDLDSFNLVDLDYQEV